LMDSLELLFSFFTVMTALSMATQGTVEIIKKNICYLNAHKIDPRREARRQGAVVLLSCTVGTVLAVISGVSIPNISLGDALLPEKYTMPILVGLLASFGGPLFNEVLNILRKHRNDYYFAKQIEREDDSVRR